MCLLVSITLIGVVLCLFLGMTVSSSLIELSYRDNNTGLSLTLHFLAHLNNQVCYCYSDLR